jgi:hypothetical protein
MDAFAGSHWAPLLEAVRDRDIFALYSPMDWWYALACPRYFKK